MKHFILFAFSLLLSLSIWAQKSHSFSFNGIQKSAFEKQKQNLLLGKTAMDLFEASSFQYKDIKQRLDSFLVYFGGLKNGNKALIAKEEYIYNAIGHCIKEMDFDSPILGGPLVPSNQMIYEFNEQGEISRFVFDQWLVGIEQWRHVYSTNYYYDNEMLETAISLVWNNDLLKWEQNYKYFYSYNEQGIVKQVFIQTWDNENEWLDYQKVEYHYDAQNRITNRFSYQWQDNLQLWKETYKEELSYTSQGEIESDINYQWSNQISDWIPLYKTKYDYLESGEINELIESYYEFGEWYLTIKNSYTYNEDGIFLGTIEYDYVNENWIEWEKKIITYDMNYSENELLVPRYYWQDMPINYMVKQLEIFQKHQNWDLMQDINFYYSPQNVDAVTEPSNKTFSIYPNPSNGIINLEINEDVNLLIYNSTGQLIMHKLLSAKQNTKKTLDLSLFKRGIYFFQIDNGKETIREKVIIQ